MSFNDLEQGFGVSSSARARVQQAEGTDSDYKTLTQSVAQQVFHINGNITSINRLVGFLGTSRDTADIRNKLQVFYYEGTRDLIKDTTFNIKSLTQYTTADPKKSRQRKLEQQKLSKDFQKVVEEFQKIQRISVSKQREYVDKKKATTAALQSQVEEEQERGDPVLQEQQQLQQADDAQRRIQIEALDNEIEYNETLISEREGEIQGIEQGITELNEIFRDLGMLVNEQESGIREYIRANNS
ncbi:hypothetical protein [Parasitella parasitica]|uniref:t-SNARE coiled-coil homology domain-containing protein n=1 Tax=Parasitella parasitica TaxID=35722 RepID=A0A0B7MWT8_9FUNG|nr:hypothetical protein [Parasitella parasitica]